MSDNFVFFNDDLLVCIMGSYCYVLDISYFGIIDLKGMFDCVSVLCVLCYLLLLIGQYLCDYLGGVL